MTKCPQCGTVFSASLDQLQLRKGYIRCVNCAHIFDGYEAVVPQGASTALASGQTPTPPVATGGGMPQVLRQRGAVASMDEVMAAPRGAVEPSLPRHAAPRPEPRLSGPRFSEPRLPEPSIPEPSIPESRFSGPEQSEPTLGRAAINFRAGRPEPVLYPDSEALDDDIPPVAGIYAEPTDADGIRLHDGDRQRAHGAEVLPDFLQARSRHRSALMRLLWSVLILIGLVCLVLQLAYVYRMQIASNVPLLRPILEQACEPLQCKVGYPRRIERIAIMNSSLQAMPQAAGTASADESVMQLRVVLRNTYDKPQTWPALTLDLVDFSGTVVVRRRLAPKAYLPASALNGPFPAGSEIQIAVPITVSGVKINGYQLGKFYPPEG